MYIPSDLKEDLGKDIWQKLNVIEVNKIMVPRSEIVSINVNACKNELISILKVSKLARLPVYANNLDDILGFVHIKDVIQHYDSDFKIADIIRKIIFVPGLIKLSGVLAKMKSAQVHAAIVLDEHGGTDGIVTMKDIVEEVMGDIDDEHDNSELNLLIEKIDTDKYDVLAKINIKELENALNIELQFDENKYKTLNGMILDFLGRVPKIGEFFVYNNIDFFVLNSNSKMVTKVTMDIARIKNNTYNK